jgi:type IV secretion system protein TrbE
VINQAWSLLISGIGATGILTLSALELRSAQRLHSLRKRRGRYSFGHANILLYRALIRPDLIKLSNGALLAMFEMDAPDSDTHNAVEVARTDFGLGKAIGSFDSRMVVHLHLRNTRYAEYDQPRRYPQPELAWLDEQRKATFTGQSTYMTRRVISIAWLPYHRSGSCLQQEEQAIAEFEERLQAISALFRSYGTIRRLGIGTFRDQSGEEHQRSEMLEHLAWCISGRSSPMRLPPPGLPLNGLLAQNFRGGMRMRVADQETRIVVIKGFPNESMPEVFARMRELKVEYTFVLRWMPLLASKAKQHLKDAHAEWLTKAHESLRHIDPHTLTMAEDARQAIGQVSAGAHFGLTTIWVTLRAPDAAQVEEAANNTVALFDTLGYTAFLARLTSEDEYCGQLPGDGYHGNRQYLLHAVNIAHLFSFHNESTGRRRVDAPNCPPDTPALLYAVAGERTLYRLNLNDEPRDVFHHLGLGGTGSGKSVALGHIAAQWVARMPNAGFTGIDRGRSLYRLTRFLDGTFYDLLGENSPGFALFSDIDDEQNARELLDLLQGFLEIQGVSVAGTRRTILEQALESTKRLPPHLRSLSGYCELVRDPENVIVPALRVYTREGVLGNMLDCEQDSFTTSRFTVIEVGNLMGLRENIVVPVLTAAFWKSRTHVRMMKKQVKNGNLHWLYGCDEAHTMLRHPLGQRFVLDLLKMGRKENMALGLWSNSITDMSESPMINDILEACRTRFFFRSTSDDEHSTSAYEALGLPHRGIDRLRDLAPYGMLMHQPSSQELHELSLALDPATLAILGRSRDSDQRTLERYLASHPETWREEILRGENIPRSVITKLTTARNRTRRAAA